MLRLCLWGTFRVYDTDGSRIDLSSRKGAVLMAMLATAPGGERTRTWLQDRLWGSRQREQAQQSLRRELAELRKVFADRPGLFAADRERIRIDTAQVNIDRSDALAGAIFLEGIDLPGEEGFEEWLRERRRLDEEGAETAPPLRQASLPASVVDVAAPAAGFGGKPAIAVLPFENAIRSADADIWADGMTEDLIERLSRLRWLPVIAPSSVAEMRGSDLDMAAIGRAVGAAYILRGRLAERAGQMALHLALYDGGTGQLLWSEPVALTEGVTPQAMEEALTWVVAMLESRIDNEQQTRVLDRDLDRLDINELVWRARWHLNRLSRKDAAIARKLIAKALEQRPNSADVLIQAAFAKAWDIWSGRHEDAEVLEMRALALRAMAADSFDARGYMLAGMAEMWLRNHIQAEVHFTEALRLNPSLARAHAQLGSNHYLAGNPQAAFAPLKTALRLSPLDNQVFYVLGEMAIAHFMLEEYPETLHHAELSLARRPAYFFAHVMKIAASVELGRTSDARAALARLYQVKPGFRLDDLDWQPFADRSWTERLKDRVRQAETG